MYDYSKVEYNNSHKKVLISCKIHGEFQQTPASHLRGAGCPKCKGFNKNTQEFIFEAQKKHGGKYDYSKVEYKDSYKKVIIICIKCDKEFLQVPTGHLGGHGCPFCCVRNTKSNTEEFIEKSIVKHGNLYDYSKVEYENTHKKVIIICKKHGEFQQSPSKHFAGQGCFNCINKTEGKIYVKLKNKYKSLTQQFTAEWTKCEYKSYKKLFDFCIPELKIIIELDGLQHFKQIMNWCSPEIQFENDKYKEKRANDNGYSIIRLLQEDVFNDTYDWFAELCNSIEQIKMENKIQNIYLSTGNEYEKY